MHRGGFRSARGAFFDSFFAGFGKFFFSLEMYALSDFLIMVFVMVSEAVT